MSEDNKEKGDETEKKDKADFPTLSLPGSGELSDSPTALLGTRIGSYKLVSILGEGGFGIVYWAEQEEPVKRDVALKITKPGMDSIKVIGRFEAERQALAWLDHPNIAHIYDGGTTEAGLPYFVMEYVEGTPITEYCDEQKLSIKERLELFEQVCKAAQHAHQKGIIHRDIKPSNVMVSLQDDKPVPKIIDFGIAKAVSQSSTEQTFTEDEQFVGTLEYTSPEQATLKNQHIDTRSDIYSLGVLLYELLTGTLPFESDMFYQVAFDERLRIIREEDPPRPSACLSNLGEEAEKIAQCRQSEVTALTKRLHKELEWIPLKAMRKEPDRRYQSASEFADDVRNYLNGDALIAGPESVAYRAKKFMHKHGTSITSAAIILAVLLVALVVSITMYFKAEHRSEEYRCSLYVNKINLAENYSEDGNTRRVRELLRTCPDDLRGWEWYYLWSASNQARMILRGHKERVASVTFSPDGSRIVSASDDETLKVWDAKSGIELITLRGHKSSVYEVAFSPNGRQIVSGSSDKTLKIWNANSGAELKTLRGHKGYVNSLAFSPDGKRIISSDDEKTLRVWDVASGREVMILHECVRPVAFSPDGRFIVSGCYNEKIKSYYETIKLWDANSYSEVMTLRGYEGSVSCVAFSPDGRRIALGGYSGLRLLDLESGTEVMTLQGHEERFASVAFSLDGKWIVSGSWDTTLKIWDANSGAEVMTLHGHEREVESVAFSPNGMQIISSSWDTTLRVWDINNSGEVIILRGHKDRIASIAFSPDGKRIVSGSEDKTLKIWDAESGREVMTLKGHKGRIASIAFSPDGKHIVSGSEDKTLKIWDAESGREVMTLQGHKREVRSVACSPDGRRVVSSSMDTTLTVWDVETGRKANLRRHMDGSTDVIFSVAFSPDSRQIAYGTSYATLGVFDLESGSEIMILHGHWGYILSVAFSPDGKRIISGGEDRMVKVWDIESGREVMTLLGHESYIESVAFSPDGRRIISGSLDKRIKVWDAEKGSELVTIEGHEDGVSSVAFSPDGSHIVSGSNDGTIKIWNSASPEEVAAEQQAEETGVSWIRKSISD